MSDPQNKISAPLPVLALGEVGGIAVDVNVYKGGGFRLFAQPFSTLETVAKWRLKVLVPEIWERELKAHLLQWAQQKLAPVRFAEDLIPLGNVDQADATRNFVEAWKGAKPEEVATKMLSRHLQAISAHRLKTSFVAGAQIMEDYFNVTAPFQPGKRKEFPDAFALRTLEHWAIKEKRKVLVVSDDEGCRAACAHTEHLVAFSRLVDAYTALSSADLAWRERAAKYEAAVAAELGDSGSTLSEVLRRRIATDILDFDVDARPWFGGDEYEADIQDVRLVSSTFGTPMWGPLPTILSITTNELTFSESCALDVEVTGRLANKMFGRRSLYPQWSPPVREAIKLDLRVVVTLRSDQELTPEMIRTASVYGLDYEDRTISVRFRHVDFRQEFDE